MSAFGENLRREREMRGVSLAEISQATKIGARMLDAVETERFERLPGGVFNAAFVRQYARYLGLDEDRVVAEFNAVAGSTAVRNNEERDAALSALRLMVASEDRSESRVSLPLIIALAILAVVGIGFLGWQMWRKAHPETSAPPPVTRPASAAVTPARLPEAAAPVESKPGLVVAGPATVKGLDLELETEDRVTILVSIDGRDAWSTVMRRGGHRNLKADRTVQLTVDNASAVQVTRNGEVMPALGGKGESQTITYKADIR